MAPILAPHTIGGSPVCHVLIAMMNEGLIPVKARRRVLSFLADAVVSFKHLSIVQHAGVKERSMLMMRDWYLERADKMPYHPRFNSHVKGVIAYYFRHYIKEEDA